MRGKASDYIPALKYGNKIYPEDIAGAYAYRDLWYVDDLNGNDNFDGKTLDKAFKTIQAGTNAVGATGDALVIAPGDYATDEVSISGARDFLAVFGLGGRGSVAVATSGTNKTALTVVGTSANRARDISFYNIGGEADGTGFGLYVKANIRRFRAYGCKFEGGAAAVKLESTGADPLTVADTILEDCELAWATVGLSLSVSGAGDPVTQTYLRGSLIHNVTADGVLTDAQCNDVWVVGNTFAYQEDGTEPTQYLDIDDTGVTGYVANNYFATTVFSTAKFAIASGVIFTNNISERENPSANIGGTNGRPD